MRAIYYISTHTLTWSVTITAKSLGKLLAFQLTRSRGAWLHNILYAYILNYISTHTLTWSVTDDFASLLSSQGFQLTRSRGAWPCYRQTEGKAWNFNSHAHVERDQRVQRCWGQRRISTHTLTWSVTYIRWVQSRPTAFQLTRSRGAWRNTCIICHFYWYFNSHAHVERDIITTYQCTQDVHFNSHAHVERDRHAPEDNHHRRNFNSHAHVERDLHIRLYHFLKTISTHTLTWSVTVMNKIVAAVKRISTHTLTWSVTYCKSWQLRPQTFQLTRSRGAWHSKLFTLCILYRISTHTLTWSVTYLCDLKIGLQLFQLTRSRGAWQSVL